MNSRMNFLILGMVFMFTAGTASAMPDQDASDMLTSHGYEENSDAVVKWGSSDNKKEKRAINPISDSSFGDFTSAGGAGRAPAAEAKPEAKAAERKMAAKTLVRNLAEKKAVQEVALIVNDLGFFPSNIFVTQGIPVRLFVTGASKKSQCFMMDSFGIRRQIQNQKVEEVTFTPDQAGSYAFTCPMNGAKGTVMVKELDFDRLPANIVSPETASRALNNDSKEPKVNQDIP